MSAQSGPASTSQIISQVRVCFLSSVGAYGGGRHVSSPPHKWCNVGQATQRVCVQLNLLQGAGQMTAASSSDCPGSVYSTMEIAGDGH